MTNIIGANLTFTTTDAKFGLGDRTTDSSGNEYVYVKASAAIDQYAIVTIDETYSTVVAGVSTSNDARGDLLGVAPIAFASADYGWVQIKGPCTILVLASATANGRLNTTAQAGYADDDATTGSIQLEGIYLTATRTASSGSAAAILNYPIQGAVL